jgi:hypothetical protein
MVYVLQLMNIHAGSVKSKGKETSSGIEQATGIAPAKGPNGSALPSRGKVNGSSQLSVPFSNP